MAQDCKCGAYWVNGAAVEIRPTADTLTETHTVAACTDASGSPLPPFVLPGREGPSQQHFYSVQVWRGQQLQWEESHRSPLQALFAVKVESKRIPDCLYRLMAEGRDYCEVWQNGQCLRVGTLAQTVRVLS